MFSVKLSIATDNEGCGRQLPGHSLEWKGYKFFINQPVTEADFWVVYSKGKRVTESCYVAPENTLFITGEPDSIYHYSKGFINQFAKVISCQQKLKHLNLVHNQPAQPWHIGKITHPDNTADFTIDYDELKASHPIKTKLISVISSNKVFTKGHRERFDFVQKLKLHYGDKIDVYGRGFNDFEDKWDVIAPYKYHIAIENCSSPYYWTEKIADAYLGNSFPFYYGAPNIGNFFPAGSFICIDIHDSEKTIEIIDRAISENVADNQSALIEKSKQLVLDKYNLFNLIVEQVQTMNPYANKQFVTLKSDTSFFDINKLYIMGVKRIHNKISQRLLDFFK